MKATNPSIAKLLLPALLLAFFHTQAGAQINVTAYRQANTTSNAAGSGEATDYGPSPSSFSEDVGPFNPGTYTSSSSVSLANASTSASQDSNIDVSDPTHLRVTASLSEGISLFGAPPDAQDNYGTAGGAGQSYFTIQVSIGEPFTLTLSNVTTTRDSNLPNFSNMVTLTDNTSGQVLATFGEDTNGTYLQNNTGNPFVVSGTTGDYTLTAVVQDNVVDTGGGAVSSGSSGPRSASFQLDVTTAPEPSSALLLLGSGAILLLRRRRRAGSLRALSPRSGFSFSRCA